MAAQIEHEDKTIDELISQLESFSTETEPKKVPTISLQRPFKDRQGHHVFYFKNPYTLNTQVSGAVVKEGKFGKNVHCFCTSVNDSLLMLLMGLREALGDIMYNNSVKMVDIPFKFFIQDTDEFLLFVNPDHKPDITKAINVDKSSIRTVKLITSTKESYDFPTKGPFDGIWNVRGIKVTKTISETGAVVYSMSPMIFGKKFIVKKVDVQEIVDAFGNKVSVKPLDDGEEEEEDTVPSEVDLKSTLAKRSNRVDDGFDQQEESIEPQPIRGFKSLDVKSRPKRQPFNGGF